MWTLISHCATVDDVCPVTCGPTFAGLIGDLLVLAGIGTLLCSYDWVCRFCVQLDTLHFLLRMVRIREMLYSLWISVTINKVQEDKQGLYSNETRKFLVYGADIQWAKNDLKKHARFIPY